MSDATALSPDSHFYSVYLGFWTNWTNGSIRGATLTLSRQNGGLLTAFLALYVGSTGKSFWRIGCFVLHRCLSSEGPQDGLYHQRQAILRNADTAEDAVTKFINASRAWKSKTRRPWLRLLPLVIFAVFAAIAFGLASIFSSRVTTDGLSNQVLLSGKNCGWWQWHNNMTNPDGYFNKRIFAYLNYASQCYTTSSNPGDCHLYTKQKLPYNITADATCPFDDEICKTQNGNLIMDTGYLDSHHDFGLNSPPGERFQWRQIYHCAPLMTEGYSDIHLNASSATPAVKRYYYGERSEAQAHPPGNFTYEVPLNNSGSSMDDASSFSIPIADYSLGQLWARAGTNESYAINDFTPNNQLWRADADVQLIFLSAPGIRYSGTVEDLWYSAHAPGPGLYNLGQPNPYAMYIQDEPASALGCAIQEQFCNPNGPNGRVCEPLGSSMASRRSGADIVDPVTFYSVNSTIWPSQGEQNAMSWAKYIMSDSSWYQASMEVLIQDTGTSGLASRYSLNMGRNKALKSNQWQEDLEHWFSASLASYQAAFVEMVNGPPKQFMYALQRPNTTEVKSMCRNQLILTSNYSSFSVLGMAIIFIIGGIFMLLDLFLETLVDRIQRHRWSKNTTGTRHARLEWKSTSALQLQRIAHEGLGLGTWSNATRDIPVTAPGESLAVLDIANEQHPLLRRPSVFDAPSLAGSEKSGGNIEALRPSKTA